MLKGTILGNPGHSVFNQPMSQVKLLHSVHLNSMRTPVSKEKEYYTTHMQISLSLKKTAFYVSPGTLHILSNNAAVKFSPVLQGVLYIFVRTCSYLAFSLLVFSFSCLLKKNTFDTSYSFSKYKIHCRSVKPEIRTVWCHGINLEKTKLAKP